ncbi:MAG: HAMP domain-containing sensor histidine kinase [Verrucomicrobiota bacterium]|nr:HAMP domain-containing sensor histidine kinase [Verrucomicrobiota bacterium]
MKTRLALIVLGLVILPTAVLSLLSSAVLRDWELTLRRRLEIASANAIHEASSHVRARLEDNIERARFAVAESLGRGVNLQELPAVAGRLQNTSPLVEQIYVYMSPVGLIYPEPEVRGQKSEAGAPRAERGEERLGGGAVRSRADEPARLAAVPPGQTPEERLAERLRQEIAKSSSRTDMICFVCDDAIYCFSFLRNRHGLYAGFRVSAEEFDRMLNQIMSLLSAGGFVLSSAAPGDAAADVVITDSFSPAPRAAAPAVKADGRSPQTGSEVLVKGRLEAPFGFVAVTAFLDETDASERGTGFQGRLYGWGILLAAGFVVVGAVLIFREAAAEIRRARDRSNFVMGVSHDLRTPVSSLRMLAESLYLGHVRDADKQRSFLGMIVRECDWLADSVERLLFFVRQEHDAVAYSMGEIDPGLLARSAVDTLAGRLGMVSRSKGGSSAGVGARMDGDGNRGIIETAIAPALPRVRGDWEALVKVVFNLLDNAVKYGGFRVQGSGFRVQGREATDQGLRAGGGNPAARIQHPGSAPTESALTTRHSSLSSVIEMTVLPVRIRGREGVTIAVRDHGIGIERGELKKIFQKFYRASSGLRREIPGVGLGLALCRDIVRAHRGRIKAESKPGEGSVFTVWLPSVKA